MGNVQYDGFKAHVPSRGNSEFLLLRRVIDLCAGIDPHVILDSACLFREREGNEKNGKESRLASGFWRDDDGGGGGGAQWLASNKFAGRVLSIS